MQAAKEARSYRLVLCILSVKKVRLCTVLIHQHGPMVVQEAPACALAQTYPVGGKVHDGALTHVPLCHPDEVTTWTQEGVCLLQDGAGRIPEGVRMF